GHLSPLVANHGPDELARWANVGVDGVLAAWRGAWETWGRAGLIGDFLEGSRGLLDLLTENPCKHAIMAQRAAYLLERLPNLPSDPDPRRRLAEIVEHARVQGGGKKTDWADETIYDRVKDQLDDLRKRARRLAELVEFEEEAAAKAANLGLRFARLALEARL